jgi:hypothetical protein
MLVVMGCGGLYMKMGAAVSSKTLVTTHKTTGCHSQEDHRLKLQPILMYKRLMLAVLLLCLLGIIVDSN